MLNLDQKEFVDTLARAIALESLEQTGKGDYYELMEYVIHEADYDDIVLEVFDKKHPLMEQAGMYDGQFIDTDVERARRLSQIERALSPLIGTGIALFASGKVSDKVIDPAAKILKGYKPGGQETNLWGGFIKGAGGMLAWSAIGLATKILMKFLMVTIEKSKSICRASCKKKINPQAPNARLMINGCSSECKIQGLKNTVAHLRSQITQCRNTPNPEKCQTTLVKIVGKYNDLLAEEQNKLKSYAAQLQQKNSIESQTGGTRPPQQSQGEQ